MAETMIANPVILKILNGVQAGVEVVLHDGTFRVGSGAADDVQLIDVSLKPGHARLRVHDGKVEIMADAGALRSVGGLALAPGSEWHAVEPLDVVTAGSMRIALGPASAHWDSISDADADLSRFPARQPPGGAPAEKVSLRALKVPVLPALGLLLLCAFGAWIVLGSPTHLAMGRRNAGSALEQTRAALDQFPFGHDVEARQEVDGAVYVTGYVETPVERRALANALEQTGLQQRVRLWVLESLRNEVAEQIKTQKANVGFDLTSQGNLTLTGLVLNPGSAAHLVSLIKDDVFGLHAVDSRIRTAPDLLADVRKLVDASQLQTWLLLRLDNDLIEISGALPVAKVDAWVGFLQKFAKTYAKDIGLRSFVQLQTPGGQFLPAPSRALAIGAGDTGRQDLALDLDKLRNGNFALGDLFVGKVDDPARSTAAGKGTNPGQMAPGPEASSGAGATATAGPRTADAPDLRASARIASPVVESAPPVPGPAAAGVGATSGATEPATAGAIAPARAVTPSPPSALTLGESPKPNDVAGRGLTRAARALIGRWRDGSLARDPDGAALGEALNTLGFGDDPGAGGPGAPDWFVPLLSDRNAPGSDVPCWSDAQIRPRDLPPALFWLDLLSATDKRSLASLSLDEQMLVLEVALNPRAARACAGRSTIAGAAADHSLYLKESRRNPGFIRFIVRDLPSAQLDISGVDISHDRFVLTRSGLKMHEGSAPDRTSRVALVGELGAMIQQKSGLSSLIFDPSVTWTISP